MIRSLAAVLTLAAGWSFTDLSLDRLRWNARERTQAGIEVLETENKQAALEAFETAARLDPANPLLRYNAGSAHLVAGTEAATQHLELAAETAPEELRPAASYNLGNARLNSGDPAGAIEAYEQTLRLTPNHLEAKFNLELALQQQQQQQEQQQENQDDKDADQDDQGQENQPSSDEQQEQPQGSNQDEQEKQEQNGEGEQEKQLPQFEEQPDMSAEQAAAILEAVENLEREQRRKQAEQEMKKRPHKGKDW
ncbi:MAG: tetratricopeptide repeat protein [bacterium]|nr:tetratricopeptide repeat protein [bacterium]